MYEHLLFLTKIDLNKDYSVIIKKCFNNKMYV